MIVSPEFSRYGKHIAPAENKRNNIPAISEAYYLGKMLNLV
jgi:hypothetical protein